MAPMVRPRVRAVCENRVDLRPVGSSNAVDRGLPRSVRVHAIMGSADPFEGFNMTCAKK